MQNVYIGVYGTSNKTEVKLEHEDGHIIGYAEVEEANIHLSVKHAWDAILRAINTILKPTNMKLTSSEYSFHIGLGLKYTELIEVCIAFKKAVPKGIKSIQLKADGHVLCLGTHQQNGSVIIVDEGIVGNAAVGEHSYKVGGWGFPHADVGSYPWIGLEAIRLTLQWIDGYIESTSLIEAIYKYFDKNPYEIVHWSMQNRQWPNEYLIICNIVLNHLRTNDPHAKMLLKKTAAEVDKIYNQLLQKTKLDELPCYLYGYIAPYIEGFLSDKIKKHITHPNGDGLTGAIKMIKAEVNAR